MARVSKEEFAATMHVVARRKASTQTDGGSSVAVVRAYSGSNGDDTGVMVDLVKEQVKAIAAGDLGQLESSLRARAQLEKEGYPSVGERDYLRSQGVPGLWMQSLATGHGPGEAALDVNADVHRILVERHVRYCRSFRRAPCRRQSGRPLLATPAAAPGRHACPR